MLDGGVVEEVRALLARPEPVSSTFARAHGLSDVVELLEGAPRAACEQRLVERTRQYAKRQQTWLRRLRRVRLVDGTLPVNEAAAEIEVLLAAGRERRLYHPRRDHTARPSRPRSAATCPSRRPPTRSPRPSPCSTPASCAWPSPAPDGAVDRQRLAAAGDPAVLPPRARWPRSRSGPSRTTTRSRSSATRGGRRARRAARRRSATARSSRPGAILMPSYVNIGARVGAGTMVDTWATVGSGAQVGRDVHLSRRRRHRRRARAARRAAGDHRGRRLHRLARCIVVEGVHVERRGGARRRRGAHRVDRRSSTSPTPEAAELRGRVPARSVVIPGTRPRRRSPAGKYGVPCALIIGQPHASRPTARPRSTRRCGTSTSPV